MKNMKLFLVTLVVQLELFMVVVQALQLPLKTTAPLTKPKVLPKILPPQDYLSSTHYQRTCPDLESIIHQNMTTWFANDSTIAASIIRLHFHDCAVRGCDASILLNHPGSERRAAASMTLRGYQVIDDIKAEVEKRCPKTVSCADILTAAARDASVLVGGPFWEVPFGRKDGTISIAKEADLVPQGHENITSLIEYFSSRGLNVLDLVVLSGSHTIGRSSCHAFQNRLSKFNGTRNPDPTLDVKYVNSLKRICKWDYNFVDLDVTTPRNFDTAYYTNLEKNLGLLPTDQLLYSDARTSPYVSVLATQPSVFFTQFAVSMIKLGNVNVLTRKNEGQIRLNCNVVN